MALCVQLVEPPKTLANDRLYVVEILALLASAIWERNLTETIRKEESAIPHASIMTTAARHKNKKMMDLTPSFTSLNHS